MHKEFYTTSFGSYNSPLRVLSNVDRFEMVDEFLQNIRAYCEKPVKDGNNIIISKYGEIWMNDRDRKIKADRLLVNQQVVGIHCVKDMSYVASIKDVLYQAQLDNMEFNVGNNSLMKEYGTLNTYPEFFGIEISFIASNHFAMSYGLVEVKGPDSDTFHNVNALLHD